MTKLITTSFETTHETSDDKLYFLCRLSNKFDARTYKFIATLTL